MVKVECVRCRIVFDRAEGRARGQGSECRGVEVESAGETEEEDGTRGNKYGV